jgi:hypothetical protein
MRALAALGVYWGCRTEVHQSFPDESSPHARSFTCLPYPMQVGFYFKQGDKGLDGTRQPEAMYESVIEV